jgi:hypothetical protein
MTLHELPRPDYESSIIANGTKVITISVHDNDFEPANNNYRVAVGLSTFYVAGPGLLMLLIYAIARSTEKCTWDECCSKEQRRKNSGRWMILVYAILALCTICLAYIPRSQIMDGIDSNDVILDDVMKAWGGLDKDAKTVSSAASAMQAEFAASGCDATAVSSLTPGLESFSKMSAEHEVFAADVVSRVDKLDNKYMDGLTTFIDVYLGVMVGVLVIVAVIVYVALEVKSHRRRWFMAFQWINGIAFSLFFIDACMQFMFSLVMADYCSDPDKGSYYMIETYMEESSFKYASYYVMCEADPDYKSNPFETEVEASQEFLTKVQASENSVIFNSCSNQPAVSQFFSQVNQAQQGIASMIGRANCKSLATGYLDITKEVCGDMVTGLTWMWGCKIAVTVFLYIAMWHTACLRTVWVKIKDDQSASDSDSDEEEKQLLPPQEGIETKDENDGQERV